MIYDIGEGEDWITVKTSTGAIGLAPKLYIAKSAGLEPLKPPPLILPSRSISLEDEVRNDVIMEQSADNPLESHISLPAPPYPVNCV